MLFVSVENVFLTEDERTQMKFVFVCDLQIRLFVRVCVCLMREHRNREKQKMHAHSLCHVHSDELNKDFDLVRFRSGFATAFRFHAME